MELLVKEYLIYTAFLFVLTYAQYIFIMRMKQRKDEGRLGKFMEIGVYLILPLGLVYDFLLNVFFGSLIFLELPHEGLLTTRLKRLKKGNDWRAPIAKWLCAHLLNPFHKDHC